MKNKEINKLSSDELKNKLNKVKNNMDNKKIDNDATNKNKI